MEKFAKTISYILSPLLMPTYGIIIIMFASLMSYFVPIATRWVVTAIVFAITCALPVISIFALWRRQIISDPALNNRKDRTIPYGVAIVCYVAAGLYLHILKAFDWISLFMYGGALAIFVVMLINRRWKISGHATGMGGLTALTFFMIYHGIGTDTAPVLFMALILISGLVCSCRLLLNRHTLLQVGAGYAVGFACVYGTTALWALLS